jgi:hypothetical protein
MTESEAETIARLSFHNRARVAAAAECGCFHCQAVFPGSDVREWVDDGQTALCPHCSIDAVLADVTGANTLHTLRHYRFETIAPATEAVWQTART